MRNRSVILVAPLASACGQSERASQSVQDNVATSSAENGLVLPRSVSEAAVANGLRGKTVRFAMRSHKSE